MATKSHSAEKRHRQSEERRIRNKKAKSAARSSARAFLALAAEKKPDEAEQAFRVMVKKFDTAAGKGIINKKAAARKKSRMHKRLNALKAAR